ncbi:MAG: molecular chaperone TorD family protein [Myxococcota bacterium]
MRSESAEARHRAYALFGLVLTEGLSEATVETLQQLPAIADVLPRPFEADLAAAAHQEALGRQVFPYESTFRAEDGLLGGAVAAEVHAAYREGGFAPDVASIEPDHIGLQLAYLAHLARAEADAIEDGHAAVVERCRGLSRRFLERHAGVWWPGFAAALATQTSCAWLARIAALAVELTLAHRGLLGLGLQDPLPVIRLDLDDPETGLRRIVNHLVRPIYSGMFLSLHGMGRAARVADLPSGFGSRVKVLESLWHTAADHHGVPRLCSALVAEVEATAEVLREFGALDPRLDATREALLRVGQSVSEG